METEQRHDPPHMRINLNYRFVPRKEKQLYIFWKLNLRMTIGAKLPCRNTGKWVMSNEGHIPSVGKKQ